MDSQRGQNESLKATINRRLNQQGLAKIARAAQVCTAANQLAAGRYVAVRFRGGTLFLKAANAVALHELKFETEQITKKIRSTLGWPIDQDIKIRLTL